MSEPVHFHLPDVGEGLTEAEVVAWHVAVGDPVELNQLIVDIETAKSIVELPSPLEGTVVELCAQVGETVPVGGRLIAIASPVESADEAPVAEIDLVEDESSATVGESPQVLVGSGVRRASARRIRLTPPADGGTVATRDRAVGRASPSDLLVDERRIPVRGVRKATAAAMVSSAFTAPHATEWVTVDVTATMDLLRRLRSSSAWSGVRLTPLVLVAKALVLAVRAFPEINASWDEESQEIIVRQRINLGVAAATPRGLLVPNIKDAQDLDLRELAEALAGLVELARAGRTPPEDMARGTITLTNIGAFGIDGGTPILNPGEAAILAVGAIRPLPWVVEGEIVVRQTTTLCLSFDHRLVDGELGSRVLHRVGELLSAPETAVLM
ncbi:hypothetical protein GCM10009788_32750 [Nocardioides humi]|uniref:Dihydrolipoamide acetyltransferase component of pyruvate dehydrogenase complex n=1 Tax=Nocardioides humi TaxID=449461 RepID=A0ABN2AW75_9ACTN